MSGRSMGYLVALGLGVGLLIGLGAGGRLATLAAFPSGVADMNGPHIPLSEAGRRIASGLSCPCGCPDLLLACNCGNARGAGEVKLYINEQLAAGRSEADVRIDLINRYGAAIQKVQR